MVWTCDEDWVNKYMVFRVEGKRPGTTWLESVEADMAEPEIDRKKWKKNVMKRKSNPIGQPTINR